MCSGKAMPVVLTIRGTRRRAARKAVTMKKKMTPKHTRYTTNRYTVVLGTGSEAERWNATARSSPPANNQFSTRAMINEKRFGGGTSTLHLNQASLSARSTSLLHSFARPYGAPVTTTVQINHKGRRQHDAASPHATT